MTPEKPKRAFWGGPQRSPNVHFGWAAALNRGHNSTRRPPEREENNENLRRERVKKKRYFETPHPWGLHPFGLPPFIPPKFGLPPLRPPPFGRPRFLVLGTHPLDPTPKMAQSLVPAPRSTQKKQGTGDQKKKKKQKKQGHWRPKRKEKKKEPRQKKLRRKKKEKTKNKNRKEKFSVNLVREGVTKFWRRFKSVGVDNRRREGGTKVKP